MNTQELIDIVRTAKVSGGATHRLRSGRRVWRMAILGGATMAMLGSVSGCITVNAPAKPIVIELNINIKQEVVYRLAADAGKTINSNKDIF